MSGVKLLAEWFWVDRWMGSSAFLLPLEARGLYREMLTQAWRRGAQLPNDHEAIQRAVGCTRREWTRVWGLIEKYWRVDGEMLVNDTQQAIYAEAKARQDRAQARAQAGAQARHKQHVSTAQGSLKDCPPISDLRSPNKKQASPVAPAKTPDPRVRDFLQWFQEEYRTRRHGADYLVKWDKHGSLVKQMLGATDLDRLKKYAQILLSDKTDDEFIVSTDRGIEILSARFSWLSDRLAAWEQKRAANA